MAGIGHSRKGIAKNASINDLSMAENYFTNKVDYALEFSKENETVYTSMVCLQYGYRTEGNKPYSYRYAIIKTTSLLKFLSENPDAWLEVTKVYGNDLHFGALFLTFEGADILRMKGAGEQGFTMRNTNYETRNYINEYGEITGNYYIGNKYVFFKELAKRCMYYGNISNVVSKDGKTWEYTDGRVFTYKDAENEIISMFNASGKNARRHETAGHDIIVEGNRWLVEVKSAYQATISK